MECKIEWLNIAPEVWEDYFRRIPRSNLLQHYSYARAVCPIYRQRARWALIRADGKEAGLFQILEAGALWNIFHAVILDRGPLWFEGYGGFAHIQAFFAAFAREFPARLGRKRRVLPEVEASPMFAQMMEGLSYAQMDAKEYETSWIDLRINEETLRSRLKKNWRGTLKKAEEAGLDIQWDRAGIYTDWLLDGYARDKAEKGYDGPAPEILRALIAHFSKTGDAHIARAVMGGEAVAGILILSHGRSATYQIGWTTSKGRDVGAHHALLWKSLHYLKEREITDFDLGGMNEKSAKNVKKFKDGLGGVSARLAGFYC